MIALYDTPWSAGDITMARYWRSMGIGSTEIGRRLGRTRNAVIGKLHRAGDGLTDPDAPIRARTKAILDACEVRWPQELREAA